MPQEKDEYGRIIAERIKLTGIRKVITDRMLRSSTEYPQAMISMSANASKLMELKAKKAEEGVHISYGDMFVKAASVALEKHPELNGNRIGDEVVYFRSINIGMMANLNGMLLEPVVCDTEYKTVEEISADLALYYQYLKKGKLMKVPLGCSTFSISSMGQYPVESCTPMISPPNIAILGIGGIRKVPAVLEDDSIEVQPRVGISVTIDHGSVDGIPLCGFMTDFIKAIEDPYSSMYKVKTREDT